MVVFQSCEEIAKYKIHVYTRHTNNYNLPTLPEISPYHFISRPYVMYAFMSDIESFQASEKQFRWQNYKIFKFFQKTISIAMRRLLALCSCVLVFLVQTSYAPVPRCSPFIIINKIPESSNFMNDFNPYFPVPGIYIEEPSVQNHPTFTVQNVSMEGLCRRCWRETSRPSLCWPMACGRYLGNDE